MCGLAHIKWLNGAAIKFFSSLVLLVYGIIRTVRRETPKEIYTKYFGDNYNYTYDDDYTLIISNHTGWVVNFIKSGYFVLYEPISMWFYFK